MTKSDEKSFFRKTDKEALCETHWKNIGYSSKKHCIDKIPSQTGGVMPDTTKAEKKRIQPDRRSKKYLDFIHKKNNREA